MTRWHLRSPSPRRAWIEIYCGRCSYQYEPVALPTEGADRNYGRNAITGNLIVVALPTEDVDRITARVARRASNSPHPDTLRPGKAAWRENCPAGWGHPALRGSKNLCAASNRAFPPHPARSAPPSPQGEGFPVRQIFSSRPGNAAWRENCPAGWGHPALQGDKKSLCGIQPDVFPSSGACRTTFPPRGRLFSALYQISFFSPPNHLTIRFVYAKLIAYNQLYATKGGSPYAYHRKK